MPMTLSVSRAQDNRTAPHTPLDTSILDGADESGATPSLGEFLRRMQPFSSRQHFERNEALFDEGDSADRVYKVISGVVRLCRHTQSGGRHIADFVLPGELIGFAEYAQHPFTAEAVTPVTVTAYRRSNFERLAEENPALRAHLFALLTANLLATQHHLFVLGSQSSKERFASFLLRLARRTDTFAGDRLDLPMGRLDIADHLGLTIETVCRAISALKDDGIIIVPNSHQLILRDFEALRSLAIEI